jgi:hypothetical protein
MNSQIAGLRIASAVFGLMFLGQLVRLAGRLDVQVGSCAVPLWWSGVALVIAGALSGWLWWLSRQPAAPKPVASPPS